MIQRKKGIRCLINTHEVDARFSSLGRFICNIHVLLSYFPSWIFLLFVSLKEMKNSFRGQMRQPYAYIANEYTLNFNTGPYMSASTESIHKLCYTKESIS